MRRLRVLIADDEAPALNLVKSYVNKLPNLELVSECQNGNDVIEALKNNDIDLLFLDIQMPGMSGIELSKRISSKQKVIFTTAFPNYAIDGFKVDALDYLLKPFDSDEFTKAVHKATDWFTKNNAEQIANSFFIKTDYRLERIHFDDILFAESDRDYVKLYLISQVEPISSLMNLKDLEEHLPTTTFMRIHRSFIINLNKINRVERNQVIIGNQRITIAETYRTSFANYLQKHTL
jgi:two-component system, LytTR family, response regulator